MNISNTSGAYGGGQAQRLLAALLQPTNGAGKNRPGGETGSASGAAPAGGPPPGPPPGGGARSFASNTLASLLSVQEEPSSSNIADQLIQDADSDGDGSLSLDEVNTALKSDSSSSTSTVEAFGKLDSDSDGKLSASELSAALSAFKAAHQRSGQSQAAVSA